jgi:hypothetical protein
LAFLAPRTRPRIVCCGRRGEPFHTAGTDQVLVDKGLIRSSVFRAFDPFHKDIVQRHLLSCAVNRNPPNNTWLVPRNDAPRSCRRWSGTDRCSRVDFRCGTGGVLRSTTCTQWRWGICGGWTCWWQFDRCERLGSPVCSEMAEPAEGRRGCGVHPTRYKATRGPPSTTSRNERRRNRARGSTAIRRRQRCPLRAPTCRAGGTSLDAVFAQELKLSDKLGLQTALLVCPAACAAGALLLWMGSRARRPTDAAHV